MAVLLEKGKPPSVRDVQLETITEGPCVQMLHVGPYEKEPKSIEQMRVFAKKQAMRFHSRHHEIYSGSERGVGAKCPCAQGARRPRLPTPCAPPGFLFYPLAYLPFSHPTGWKHIYEFLMRWRSASD